MRFVDTRGLDQSLPTFSEAIIKGITASGGLFVPEVLPLISREELISLADLPYWRRAAEIFKLFSLDISPERIDELMKSAYGAQWDDKRIAPIVSIDDDTHVLELWHGPTSAFKDMALQCMPRFFSEAVDIQQHRGALENDILILVATSGDTGKAALDGFADRPHTNIAVFYPATGVSDIQRKQMVTQQGENVMVFGVNGNFDDCQNGVKHAFGNDDFVNWLGENAHLQLSSANSINWGRLMPQIVYYLSACSEMLAAGKLQDDQLLDIVVPTGNFGNILGAYYAKLMGAPIGMLLCASNENCVLADFIATGTYDISDRAFHVTPSPSMDILISSNLERLLYDIAGAEATAGWMNELRLHKRFTIDPTTFALMREHFSADSVSNDESLATIKRTWDESGYLLDPHTAVALEAGQRLRGSDPLLVVSTAHWAKFAKDVLRALTLTPAGQPLPGTYDTHSGFEMLDDIGALAPGCPVVPSQLASLANVDDRFGAVIENDTASLVHAVKSWIEQR